MLGAMKIPQGQPGRRFDHCRLQPRLAWENRKDGLIPKSSSGACAALKRMQPKRTYFVAEHEGAVAGQLSSLEWSDWRNGNFWWIQSVYVAAAHRQNGVFRALFDHVQSWRECAAMSAMRLYVNRTTTARSALTPNWAW